MAIYAHSLTNESEIRTELLYKEKHDDNFNMYKLKTHLLPFQERT